MAQWVRSLDLTTHTRWVRSLDLTTHTRWVRSLDLTTHTSLSPIQRGFTPSFVNYKKGCTRFAAASDKVYQLLAHCRWFSLGTPASSTTKTGRHDIAEILLKVALNTKNQNQNQINVYTKQSKIQKKLYIFRQAFFLNYENYPIFCSWFISENQN